MKWDYIFVQARADLGLARVSVGAVDGDSAYSALLLTIATESPLVPTDQWSESDFNVLESIDDARNTYRAAVYPRS